MTFAKEIERGHRIADAVEPLFRRPPSKRIKQWMREDAANGIRWETTPTWEGDGQ
jgi:hypothetical protein